jgi:hypothetical protein
MIFNATEHLDPEALATVIEAELDSNLMPDELLIIVRATAFEKTLSELHSDSQHSSTLARLRDRASVTLVGYDVFGREAERKLVAGPPAPRTIKLDDFKRRAMTRIFNTRHGFVEATSTYHFENPSGRHTERFIRLSNVLVRGAEIAFIGFCTLPFVSRETAIAYLDTPSLYAVVSAINEQRASFEDASPILADNFSSYAGVETYQFNQIGKSIVLISASSSGSLASDLLRDHPFAPSQITHMLFLGSDKSGSNIVCNLLQDKLLNPEGIATAPAVEEANLCQMCASGSHAIKLQGDQFEFAGPQQEPLLIRKIDAPANLAELMQRLVGGNIVEVGLGHVSGRMPRQFDIHTENLLNHKTFQSRLGYVMRRSLPASLSHVVAADSSSEPFARNIAENAKSVQVIKRDDLDTIPPDTQTAIVIAAVVIESGRTLLDISRDIRSIAPNAPLLYLVGFSKTTGEPRRVGLEKTLAQTVNPYPYQFIEIERMVLPRSDESNAWSAERKLLIKPVVASLVPAEIKGQIDERVSRLRKVTEALRNDLFLANDQSRKMKLQPGFVFWPDGLPECNHTQADVFYTVASVLQQLRANAHQTSRPAIKNNWFQQTILAPENFGRFNDDIIQASILRAAHPFEMNFADAPIESRELGRLIRRIVDSANKDRGGSAAEFLLAMATGRLRLCPADTNAILDRGATGIALIDFLLAVCNNQLHGPLIAKPADAT